PGASREVVIRSTSPIPISIPSAGNEDKRKWKEIMTEPKKPAKAKVQEKMSLQLARELQEEFVHEDQSIREQIKSITTHNFHKCKYTSIKLDDV
ncbi:hypothetical protein Tco_0354606, partial [Tanacetum coccineum]